jgi:hypothetical protein
MGDGTGYPAAFLGDFGRATGFSHVTLRARTRRANSSTTDPDDIRLAS